MNKHRQQDGNSSKLNNPQGSREQDRQRQAQQNPGRSGTDGGSMSSQKPGQQGKDSPSAWRGPTDEQKRAQGRGADEQNQRRGAKADVADDRDYGHGDRPHHPGSDDVSSR